ncbi:DUF2200 domain-containing protein [Brevundimonas sp. 2R-24]|uniref:DUF2200 domain-containing protein n=1 Tax=Peiella sedimenti TaxID=3061083 RepID=A0ABT8SQN8_9CAUL|nr:DUF2200 domain-containing protein [Caulobacteraceae bacterium XZ-24]
MAVSAAERLKKMSVASVYRHYIAKAEKKGRGKSEVDEVTRWLTGYSQSKLEALLADGTTFEAFFDQAPAMNPNRFLITGVICGHRVEEIEDPFMREVRHLDKLVDEVAKGRAIEKVLRSDCSARATRG